MTRSRPLTLAALVAASALLVPAATVAGKPRPKTYKVAVGSDYYGPAALKLRVNDRIKFEWVPTLDLHDVVVDKGPAKFTSPIQSSGTYARRFTKPGKYLLYCTQHEMEMTVTVRR